MTWFDIKTLEKDLHEGNVTDKQAFNYLLAMMLITTILPYLSEIDKTNKVFLFIELAVEVVITILLLKHTFDINTKGDDKEYFKRFISLSLVLMIRLIAFSFLIVMVILIAIQLLTTVTSVTYESIKNEKIN
jgi:chromate transport protein ChrA